MRYIRHWLTVALLALVGLTVGMTRMQKAVNSLQLFCFCFVFVLLAGGLDFYSISLRNLFNSAFDSGKARSIICCSINDKKLLQERLPAVLLPFTVCKEKHSFPMMIHVCLCLDVTLISVVGTSDCCTIGGARTFVVKRERSQIFVVEKERAAWEIVSIEIFSTADRRWRLSVLGLSEDDVSTPCVSLSFTCHWRSSRAAAASWLRWLVVIVCRWRCMVKWTFRWALRTGAGRGKTKKIWAPNKKFTPFAYANILVSQLHAREEPSPWAVIEKPWNNQTILRHACK